MAIVARILLLFEAVTILLCVEHLALDQAPSLV